MGESPAKCCTRCKAEHPLDAFGKDRSRSDGFAASCLASRRAHFARTYPKPGPRKYRPDPNPPRDGDRQQARQRVNVEVRTGRRPHPNSLPCEDCGHVWKPGDRRHEYDHYRGYGAEHHGDVQAVCTTCHRARGDQRGETAQVRGVRGRFVAPLEVMCDG